MPTIAGNRIWDRLHADAHDGNLNDDLNMLWELLRKKGDAFLSVVVDRRGTYAQQIYGLELK
jgi:hypothetical protein